MARQAERVDPGKQQREALGLGDGAEPIGADDATRVAVGDRASSPFEARSGEVRGLAECCIRGSSGIAAPQRAASLSADATSTTGAASRIRRSDAHTWRCSSSRIDGKSGSESVPSHRCSAPGKASGDAPVSCCQ